MQALEKDTDVLTQLYELRATNLSQVADSLGQDLKLARVLGISPTRLHQLIRKRNVPFTEKLARAIEARLGKSYGWLDEPSPRMNEHKTFELPIYFLEDLNHWETTSPAGYYQYIAAFPDAYFVQMTSSLYGSTLLAGTLILINPQKKRLEENGIYILAYRMNGALLRPIIRKFKDQKIRNILDNEAEEMKDMVIYGKCELFINTQLG